ncbi:Uncharacterized protein PECH_007433 [Penicillium ucsense]|uniref:Peroxin 22-like protein n=1 Tax=Penicillium ucsense TaxID=2839758 RepID=A0A8J8W8L7_9EURO|nr:Uncharacterized protein PECM_000061 [Penicillium ucsense]KAF7734891.1 Uncharacterized protein PECH_007433 [Penicillium ucsense]
MSYPGEARRRGGAGNSSRTALGYWVPLALTVGVATLSIAAWIWSERDDDDDNERPSNDRDPPYATDPTGTVHGDYPPSYRTEDHNREIVPGAEHGEHQYDPSFMARMQGALRRTPSPQQLFDGASRRVMAGVTAAGAYVGGALTSIREENRGDFEDHTRWSEEAQSRATQRNQPTGDAPLISGALSSHLPPVGQGQTARNKKKTVAIVVSSVTPPDSDAFASEHASILSHLPEHVDLDTSRIFVLIYAPDLQHAIGQSSPSRRTTSLASSFSNIATEEANSSTEAIADPNSLDSRHEDSMDGTNMLFKTLYTQAQAIVEKESMIMPFNTATGFVHLVRHLSPELVYVQESLTGDEGTAAHHISGWVRQVIVVVGDEGGRGGLIDSDEESVLAEKGEKWWQKEGTIGIGKRIDVVDALRVGDDWRRRVKGLD